MAGHQRGRLLAGDLGEGPRPTGFGRKQVPAREARTRAGLSPDFLLPGTLLPRTPQGRKPRARGLREASARV